MDADAQAVETSSGTDRPADSIFPFEGGYVPGIDQLMVYRRDWVLPDEFLLRNLRAE